MPSTEEALVQSSASQTKTAILPPQIAKSANLCYTSVLKLIEIESRLGLSALHVRKQTAFAKMREGQWAGPAPLCWRSWHLKKQHLGLDEYASKRRGEGCHSTLLLGWVFGGFVRRG